MQKAVKIEGENGISGGVDVSMPLDWQKLY